MKLWNYEKLCLPLTAAAAGSQVKSSQAEPAELTCEEEVLPAVMCWCWVCLMNMSRLFAYVCDMLQIKLPKRNSVIFLI